MLLFNSVVACGNRNCMNCSDNYLTCIECKGRYSVSTDGERCEISRSAASIASMWISQQGATGARSAWTDQYISNDGWPNP